MLSDDVVHQVVEHQVLSETMKVELHILVHQIYVMKLVQKKYLLVKQVSDLTEEQNKKCLIQELESTMTTLPATSMTTTATSTTTTTTVQTSFQCYDCSGSNEQQCTTTSSNCPMCTIYRSDNDPSM